MDTDLSLNRRGLFKTLASVCILPFFPAKSAINVSFKPLLGRAAISKLLAKVQPLNLIGKPTKYEDLYINPEALNKIRNWDVDNSPEYII